LDLSISKEVFKARGKNDFRSKKQRILAMCCSWV